MSTSSDTKAEYILTGMAILAVTAFLITVVTFFFLGNMRNAEKNEHIVQACIAERGIWVDDSDTCSYSG